MFNSCQTHNICFGFLSSEFGLCKKNLLMILEVSDPQILVNGSAIDGSPAPCSYLGIDGLVYNHVIGRCTCTDGMAIYGNKCTKVPNPGIFDGK